MTVARQLEERGVAFDYEPHPFPYRIDYKYIPDMLLPNGTYLEIKGHLDATDRRKLRAVKAMHPDLDLRIVFQNAHARLDKRAKQTRAEWADANGFPWCDKEIPKSWLN